MLPYSKTWTDFGKNSVLFFNHIAKTSLKVQSWSRKKFQVENLKQNRTKLLTFPPYYLFKTFLHTLCDKGISEDILLSNNFVFQTSE